MFRTFDSPLPHPTPTPFVTTGPLEDASHSGSNHRSHRRCKPQEVEQWNCSDSICDYEDLYHDVRVPCSIFLCQHWLKYHSLVLKQTNNQKVQSTSILEATI